MFDSLTVIIPASNETDSLTKTVCSVLQSDVYDDISKIILFLKSESCLSAPIAKKIMEENNCNKIEIVIQKTATFDTAFREIPGLVESSHFIILVSDGEMDPSTIPHLVHIAKEKPESIVCGSKWHKDSIVENPSFIRSLGSKAINRLAAVIFSVRATDIFSIFQVYPLELYKKVNATIAEYTLLPLRMGVEYIEVPTCYQREKGKKSTLKLRGLFKLASLYTESIFRVRFTPKNKL